MDSHAQLNEFISPISQEAYWWIIELPNSTQLSLFQGNYWFDYQKHKRLVRKIYGKLPEDKQMDF